jgi:hypothetical protein
MSQAGNLKFDDEELVDSLLSLTGILMVTYVCVCSAVPACVFLKHSNAHTASTTQIAEQGCADSRPARE